MCEEGKNRVRKETEETETVSQLTRQREILHCVERMDRRMTEQTQTMTVHTACCVQEKHNKGKAMQCSV